LTAIFTSFYEIEACSNIEHCNVQTLNIAMLSNKIKNLISATSDCWGNGGGGGGGGNGSFYAQLRNQNKVLYIVLLELCCD
jgi:hypothetical protein